MDNLLDRLLALSRIRKFNYIRDQRRMKLAKNEGGIGRIRGHHSAADKLSTDLISGVFSRIFLGTVVPGV